MRISKWKRKLDRLDRMVILLKSSIAYIDISCFVHATEDLEKVMKAMKNAVPTDYAESISFVKSNLKGEYGNPIILFKSRIEDKTIAESVLRHVSSQLSTLDKEKLLQDLDLHLEKGNLYIRLDKQAALRGDLRLWTGDPLHLRIRFRKSKNEELMEILKDFGLLPNLHTS